MRRPPSSLSSLSRRWLGAGAVLAVTTAVLAGAWVAHAASTPSAAAPASAAHATASNRRGGPSGPRLQPATPVSVAPVVRRDMPLTLSALGTITAANTAVVHARVSGTLLSLGFREGQPVRAGQVLAQIDPASYRIALAQAEAQLARDQAQLANARADLQRYQGLVAQDAAPRQQLDTQQAMVRQLEAALQADEAARSAAQLQLSYTTVTAPISGLAGLKQVDLGNTVGPADAAGLVSIAQMQPAAVVFAVPAEQLPALRERLARNQPLPVQAWDSGALHPLAQGTVASLDNAIDTSTGTVKLKALFPNTEGALFANQPVSVRLQLDLLPQALVLPSAALQRGAAGLYVFALQPDGTVAQRAVQPLASAGEASAVQGALQAGDRVVVDGTDRLRDGAAVTVIEAAPSSGPGAGGPGGGAPRPRRAASAAGGA